MFRILGYFLFASLLLVPTASTQSIQPDPIVEYLLGQSTDTTDLDVNEDTLIDVADVVTAVNPQPFVPMDPVTMLTTGTHHFSSIDIGDGVEVQIQGPVTIQVDGSTTISGALMATGECNDISIISGGDLAITGSIETECDDSDGSLYLETGGTYRIGTTNTQAMISSAFDVTITDSPDITDDEVKLLSLEMSATPMAPVVFADATSVLDGVVAPGVEIDFFADAVDPDGGTVSYIWDFDDSSAASTEAEPTHIYTTPGVYSVFVTVTDDESEMAQASMTIVIEDGASTETQPNPGVWGHANDIVVADGDVVDFLSEIEDPDSDELEFSWDFGDGTMSDDAVTTHAYTSPGRYSYILTVTDASQNLSSASGSIYVHELATAGNKTIVKAPGPANVVNGLIQPKTPKAADGKRGRNYRLYSAKDLDIGPAADIRGQNGGDGTPAMGQGYQRGKNGKPGGSLTIFSRGALTLNAGSTIMNGNGGKGGDATSTNNPATVFAHARGGKGGAAGRRLAIIGNGGVVFTGGGGATVDIDPGSGGDGGTAIATAGDGMDMCPRGQDGGNARAVGGDGGRAGKYGRVRGNVTGIGNILVFGALGGNAGDATATGGQGGDANCPGQAFAQGGRHGFGEARGGKGGHATFRSSAAIPISPLAFAGGLGGDATANHMGRFGGDAQASAPACASATAIGGGMRLVNTARNVFAKGGSGGNGYMDRGGNAGDYIAIGANGGLAFAVGGDCADCGNGGDGTATGGRGGSARGIEGVPGRGGNASTVHTITGGDGGSASGFGGRGGNCDICPLGHGGNGGVGTANAGDGGGTVGPGTRTGGDGGDANATGGNGGTGASCCEPTPQAGGNGGSGGNAVSNAGMAGSPNGSDGMNMGKGGDAGPGGDGMPAGGAGGVGAGSGFPMDIPDGNPSVPGNPCPLSSVFIHIDWDAITTGPLSGFIFAPVYQSTPGDLGSAGVPITFTPAPTGQIINDPMSGELVIQGGGSIQIDTTGLNMMPAPFVTMAQFFMVFDGQAGQIQFQGVTNLSNTPTVANQNASDGQPAQEFLQLPAIMQGEYIMQLNIDSQAMMVRIIQPSFEIYQDYSGGEVIGRIDEE